LNQRRADIAKQYGIVYTIGIGNGMAEFPYGWTKWSVLFQMMKVEIDEQLMKSIAKKTDGRYFRATSNNKLAEIYGEINKLETTEIEELKFYDMMRSTDLCLACRLFIVSRDWFEEYDLQKFYLKVKSVEALSDFF
jgi:hypothetical protein